MVDDEVENLDVLQAILEDQWKVLTAEDGPAALEKLIDNENVDLVIADQRMPGMMGIDLLTRIADTHPDIIRVVLTAYSDVEPMLDAINRGSVYRFILKPFEPTEMRAMVVDAINVKDNAVMLRHLVQTLMERRDEMDRTLKELRDTQEQLLSAERLTTVGRATVGIVHNLRNLATVMSLLMEAVSASTSQPPSLLEAAKITCGSLKELVELFEKIRAFATTTEHEVRRGPVDIDSLLRTTVAIFEMEESGDNHKVEVSVVQPLPVLNIDSKRIGQALIALLNNAAQASAPGATISILVAAAAAEHSLARGAGDPGMVCIQVVDSGRGMSPEVLARAPEPFYSAFEPPRLGLGLEIVRLAAEAHGGSLVLNSTPGAGTRALLLVSPGDPS